MSALAILYFLSFGFDLVKVTSLFAISALILVIFNIFTGPSSDHFSRKKFILISFFLMGLAFFGLFFFSSFALLGLSWILGDIAWSFQTGTASAWIIDALRLGKRKNKLAELFSRFYFSEKVGWLIGSGIGFFVAAISFRYVWLFVALITWIMFVILAIYMEEKNFKKDISEKHVLVKTFNKIKESINFILNRKNWNIKVLIIGILIAQLLGTSYYTAVPLALKGFGLEPNQISGIFFLIGVFFLLAPFIGEKSVKKIGIRRSLFYTFFLVAIGIVIFALTHSLIIAIISLGILEMIGVASDVVADIAVHHNIKSEIRASMGSALNIVWGIGNATAVWLTGIIITNFGLTYSILISSVLSLITAVVYFAFLRD